MTKHNILKPAVIIDLDGTLCDTTHRQHHMQADKKNWKAFYDALVYDKPNKWCQQLYWSLLFNDIEVLFVSGRPDDYRNETEEWLERHRFEEQLYMRKSGDFRKDATIKTEIYHDYIEPHFNILFCVDDRQQVVDAWRSIGLTCLQCAKGDF